MRTEFYDIVLMLNLIRLSYDKQFTIYDDLGIRSITELKENLFLLPFDRKIIAKIQSRMGKYHLDKYKESMNKLRINTVTYEDDDYPENLLHIPKPPPLLYYKGQLNSVYMKGISVVGSRKYSDYGKIVCQKLVEELSYYQIPIISGLALGIDTIAHKTALEKDNFTLGVLGNGLDIIYPKSNRNLYSQMENQGCILTEFPIGAEPQAFHFPQRNNIISGIGCGVLVIEAREKSGTLITANAASSQGKEVFAVPGSILNHNSSGTNRLIQDGAKLVMGIEDILNELPMIIDFIQETRVSIDPTHLESKEYAIYQSLKEFPKTGEELCFEKSMNISEVLEIITKLELEGLIGILGDKYTIV